MGFMDIFTPSTTNKVIDSIIDSGDALIYTDEEKARDLQKRIDTKLKLLPLFEPFKIAQRYLSFIFAVNFILAFWCGVLFKFFATKEQFNDYIELVATFNLGWIMLAIISFYFGGGVIDSFNAKKKV